MQLPVLYEVLTYLSHCYYKRPGYCTLAPHLYRLAISFALPTVKLATLYAS
jgi:hypothetical protein